ncbi:helix-turn-helix domain-containing protein [Lysobacter panacisoli]|uniref:HTH araC/xylS-type domain-containing protein n=1 Tax=Lysobacter panacisoli TaxID=1255263 RepID=A0ABP9LEL0_9GAMM|nr:AraC family transcriptional regulator [Lysobacter panacisoli]
MENLVNDRAMPFDSGRPPQPYAIDCSDTAVDPMPDSRTRTSSGLSDKALARTVAYIRDHLFDSLSLGDLARIACVSRFHFARMFRARTGFSPMKYVQNERIRTAKQLLRRGEGNISSIAAALGFFDQSHFSRVFRKVTGISPGRYAQGLARDTDST